jgi:hypothetical protein
MTGSREGVRIRDPPERRETLEPGKVYIAPGGMADDGGTEVAVEGGDSSGKDTVGYAAYPSVDMMPRVVRGDGILRRVMPLQQIPAQILQAVGWRKGSRLSVLGAKRGASVAGGPPAVSHALASG